MATKESKVFEKQINNRSIVLARTAQQEDAILSQLLSKYNKFLDEKLKMEAAARKRLSDATRIGNAAEIEAAKADLAKKTEMRVAAEQQFETEKAKAKESAQKIAENYELNSYKAMNAKKKFEYNKALTETLRQEQKAQQDKQKILIQQLQLETDEKKKASIRQQLAQIENEKAVTQQYIDQVEKRNRHVAALPFNRKATLKDREKATLEKLEYAFDSKQDARATKASIIRTDEYIKAEKELKQLKKTGSKEEIEAAKTRLANLKELTKSSEEYQAAQKQAQQANKDMFGAIVGEIGQSFEKASAKFMEKATNSIEDNLDAMFGHQGRMMGRLQGSAIDWSDAVDDISDTIGFSGLVSKKSVVAKMVELVDSGVAYNLELRAFLSETSENIASTFDATNGTLLRLIRLQQADSTAARLGMEAALTDLLNATFSDTAYLADKVSDSVSSAIIDASATMSRDQALIFEYTMQKWLGSLYSVGLSSETAQSIAQGINYLATGNISALAGNDSLQTLLTMSSIRAGGRSYTDMLTTGITADETNKLLRAMIELLAEISENQTNNVTKSAYAELFGMSITDLSTFASLTTTDINNLYNTAQSYSSLMQETENQLNAISSRMNISMLVDNAIDNALVGAASTIGSNAFTYGTWKTLTLLKEYVGEIEIPGITAAGFGLASGMDLLNLAQTAVVGLGLLGSLLGGIGSMLDGGPTNLGNWDWEEYTSRGSSLKTLGAGIYETTSFSAQVGVGSASGEDASSVSMQQGKDAAYEAAGTTSEEAEEQKEKNAMIYDALAGDASSVLNVLKEINDSISGDTFSVLNVLQEIDERLEHKRVFYTASVGNFTADAAYEVTNLATQLATTGGHTWVGTALSSPVTSTSSTPSTPESIVSSASGSAATSAGTSSTIALADTERLTEIIQEGSQTGLSEIIQQAVEDAINAVLSQYAAGNGIPVTVANGGLYV